MPRAPVGKRAQLQPALCDQLRLVAGDSLRVSRVPGVPADMVELAHGVVARFAEEVDFVERPRGVGLRQRGGGAAHHHHVAEPDLARVKTIGRVRHVADVIADCDAVSDGRSGHVTCDPEAVDRSGEALQAVLVGLRKVRRDSRPLVFLEVDLVTPLTEPFELAFRLQLKGLNHERNNTKRMFVRQE